MLAWNYDICELMYQNVILTVLTSIWGKFTSFEKFFHVKTLNIYIKNYIVMYVEVLADACLAFSVITMFHLFISCAFWYHYVAFLCISLFQLVTVITLNYYSFLLCPMFRLLVECFTKYCAVTEAIRHFRALQNYEGGTKVLHNEGNFGDPLSLYLRALCREGMPISRWKNLVSLSIFFLTANCTVGDFENVIGNSGLPRLKDIEIAWIRNL